MKKSSIKPNEISRDWYFVSAQNQVLGRLATRIAKILQGKNQPYFAHNWDMGDYVIVVDAEAIVLTGNKEKAKEYFRHTGFPGGIRSTTAEEMRARKPEDMIRFAVEGMLPKTKLAKKMIAKLFVYTGSEHPHQAQQPKPLELN